MNKLTRLVLMCFLLSLVIPVFASGQKEGSPLKELHVSYVDSPFNLQVMVMKKLGLLEKEFAADGITVEWFDITSGAKQAEALASGSLDIASVMNTASLIIANAAGNDLDIIDIVSRPSGTFTLMTMPKGPQTVQELSGKTVAGPKGTVLHQLLAAIEEKENLKDVQFISLSLPEAQAALIAGRVDAALLAAALVIKTQEAGGRVLTSSEGYVNPLLISAASQSFARQYPDIVARYQKVQKEAYDYILQNPEKALEIGAEAQGISLKDAKDLYERSGMTSGFKKADLISLESDIEFLLKLEMIENPVQVSDLLAPELDVQ